MTPQKLQLEEFVEGDTWSGIPALNVLITPDGGVAAPPDSNLASVIMRWRKIESAATVVDLTTADSEITLASAANWEISIPAQIVPGLTSGRWKWQLIFTAADDSVKTYLQGDVNVSDKL